jgi:hypothetical protein
MGIEMNLAAIGVREALEEFGEGTFRAVAAIHKG